MFNDDLKRHVVENLTKMGYMAIAPTLQSYFEIKEDGKFVYSNWSERHIAYTDGLGTFGFSGNFITKCGVAHSCGSVVTSCVLPASPRPANSLYPNCLFYISGRCQACVSRCPTGSITDKGHDNENYLKHSHALKYLADKCGVTYFKCGLCLVGVPCESRRPAKKTIKKQAV